MEVGRRVKDTATNSLRLKRLGIDTQQEAVIYMRSDCHVCRAEGFAAMARVRVTAGDRSIIATLNRVKGDLLAEGEAGLSEAAWGRLDAQEGDMVAIGHPRPPDSLSLVRAKVYGSEFSDTGLEEVMQDIVAGRYSDVQVSAFVTACSSHGLKRREIVALTRAMVSVGDTLDWGTSPIVDKHCVGGLPGNRTTPIVVAIIAACGLTMPKTSSRAITSPAGTADTMETLAPVDLNIDAMRRVVEREGGCIVWGGAVSLSPADDILIRVERALDIDGEGQLVASVLSKKLSAGSTHLVLDIPVGPTAKVRSEKDAQSLSANLTAVASEIGLKSTVLQTDGRQPVGNGVGPALEALDVLSVLKGKPDAPQDLRVRSVALAAALLELSGAVGSGMGFQRAEETLDSGVAWAKFQAICEAQGGMRTPPVSSQRRVIDADVSGEILGLDNRRLAKAAKLAGAPDAKAAGIKLHVRPGDRVEKGAPLFTLHAETPGELAYALDYIEYHPPIFDIGVPT